MSALRIWRAAPPADCLALIGHKTTAQDTVSDAYRLSI
jgi:hypothetical protein